MNLRLRLQVRERAKYTCEYWKLAEEDDAFTFHIEHIIPKKHGGVDTQIWHLHATSVTCTRVQIFRVSILRRRS